MRGMLSPSLMCADMLNLQRELETLDSLSVDYVHLDFMDNKFVPNITLDASLIRAVKPVLKNMKRDIHIMAYAPQQYFERMDIGEGDIVSVHYEACDDLHDVLAEIRARGAKAFIAISPDTSVEVIYEYAKNNEPAHAGNYNFINETMPDAGKCKVHIATGFINFSGIALTE